MAGPIIVEGPDGQEYEFPEGTSPDVMKQAMRKRYAVQGTPAPAPSPVQQPQTRNTIRTGPREFPTSADRMSNREDTRIIVQAQRALAAQQEAERLARVKPVEQAAGQAGRAAMNEQWGDPMPFRESEFMLSPQEQRGMQAERQVYRDADVTSSLDAATIRGLNSIAMGIPGILNKDFRGELAAAGNDQPGASLVADVAGFFAPGALIETGVRGVAKAAQPLINRLTPKGGSMLERGTRVTGRTVGLAGSGATQSGIYQGTVGESIAAGKEDRAPSLAGAAENFAVGATDPAALLALPAALAANRIGIYVRSGGATATSERVGQQISDLTGGRVAAPNAPQSAASQVLNMGLAEAGIRSQAVDRVIRSFERAGMSREDITGLFQSVQQRLSGLPEAEAGRLTLGQALLEALENPELSRAAGSFPQAAMQLRQVLRNASQGGPIGDVPRQGDQRAGIVSGVRRELQGSQTNFAQDAIDNALGNASLISIDDLISGAKREIGGAYNDVLRAADPQRPEARGIAMIVMGDNSTPGILGRRAKNAGFESVEAYVAARPDEAGHWVRSALAKAGRSAKGREKIELDTTVAQLDELLETNAGYAEARKAYGTEMGVEDATEFGNRFIASSKNEYSVDLLMRELEGMSDRERAVALASIRNNLRSYLRGSQEEASAKISQLTNVGALNALERLGPEGVQVADTLRFLRREQGFLDNVTYGSDTARNLSAGKAEALGNTGLQNVTSGQGGFTPAMIADAAASTILGGPTAIFTPMRVAGAGIKNLFAPRVATLNDEVRFLMGRRNNVPDLPQSGTADFSAPPPPAGAPPPQAPRTVGVAPAAASVPAGAPVPTTPIRTTGIGIGPNAQATLQQSAFGSIGGSAYGSQNDVNQDGVIDERDAYAGAFLGGVGVPAVAKGAQVVNRVSDRVLGSNNPNLKGVDKKRQAYTFDVGGAKAKVTFEERFPYDGDYPRRVPTDIARLREDVRQEYITPRQALDRSVEAIVPDRYNRAALGPDRPTRTLEDFVNVEMDISNNNLTLPQAKQLFEKTFDTLEDHAIKHRRPVYYFTGAKPSQQTLYENSIKRRGAPKGYVATEGPGGLYFVREDLFQNFAKELKDDGYDVITRTVGTPRTPSGRTVGQGGYFGRQSMRPPGSGPSPREIELRQEWSTATPIVTQARTTAQSAQQAADAALQSKAPADIARAKDQKKALVGQLQEAQALRAGMDTPEDARLAETLASLAENTSDPVLLSTQISAARTSLDRLLTDLGGAVEGNLIPVRTTVQTRTQPPRSAAEPAPERPSVTRYAEGGDEIKPMGFAGPRAKDADLDALRVAQQQVAAGRAPQEVWSQTGWYQAKDGKWTFEIDDSAARIANPNGKKLDQFLSHPTLFKNYPSLRGVRVEVNPQKVRPGEAYYDRVGNKMVLGSADIDSAIHEIQHLIQKREGRLQITNPDAFDYQKLKDAGIEGDPAAGISRRDAAYNRSLSETEARASADRRGMSAEERAATFPEQSYDVAPKDVLGTTRKLIRSPFAALSDVRSAPKTPQQAARFETPGSPEYEAAVAKGLDMSQAGRMRRAKEMGAVEAYPDNIASALADEIEAAGLVAEVSKSRQSNSHYVKVFFPDDDGWGAEYIGSIRISDHTLPSRFMTVGDTADMSDPAIAQIIVGSKTLDMSGIPDALRKAIPGNGFSLDNPQAAINAAAERLERRPFVAKREGIDPSQSPTETGGAYSTPFVLTRGQDGQWNIRSVNAAFDPDKAASPILTAGFGASTSKTPQQAARFETPGSPEYEAAVAKGLDMSQAGRMRRAKEMGFDVDNVLYHGTSGDVKAFGRDTYLASDRRYSEDWIEGAQDGQIKEVYIKGRKYPADEEETQLIFSDIQILTQGEQQARRSLLRNIENEGYDYVYSPINGGETLVFDPANIRSVNAAFDPEKSTSSTLLAAAPFAAVGGAGLTLAGENARNQRTVGKPKSSQSARTVGKAKTN